jgi:hypothetical protein
MNKVLAIVGAALLLSTSVAQAVEVHANPGTKVIVFGLAKSGDNCVKANGNTICPPVQIATIVIANGGMIEVPVTAKQIRDSKKICAKVFGSTDDPVCVATNKTKIELG